MATPEPILKLKRIRDGKIVILWARHGMSVEELAEKFKLSERRIQQILYTNHTFVEFNKDWEKKKRIARLQNWLKDAKKPESNALSLQQEIRAELEGNAPGSGSGEMKIVIIRDSQGATNGRAENSSQPVSRQISI